MARIAIIGGGNMGEALLAGLLRSGRQVKDLVVAERAPARTEHLSQTYGVQVTGSITDAAAHADYVVVAVKPADVTAAVNAIAEAAAIAEDSSTEQVFVTVAAGVGTGFFESKLPAGSAVVRAMPNTPALVGAGVTAVARGRFTTDEPVGEVLTVSEAQLDAVTAVSGSGPAYFFLMVEALVDAGVAVGLPRAVATDLAVQTMAGSAAMMLDRMDGERGGADGTRPSGVDTTAAQLRAMVTSPGGTTAAGLRELERGGLRAAVAAAVEAAKTRSEQLGITSE